MRTASREQALAFQFHNVLLGDGSTCFLSSETLLKLSL
jgi:hypothetical protein